MKNYIQMFLIIFLSLLSQLSLAQAQSDQCWNPQSNTWEPKKAADCPSYPIQTNFFVDPQTGLKITIINNFAFTAVDFRISTDNKNFNGGLVWRYINLENHYGVSIDLAKRSLEIYKTDAGKRMTIKTGKISAAKSGPYEFEIRNKGDDIQFYANGKLLLQAKDSKFKNGKIGYWAKDSDNVHIQFGNIIENTKL